MSNTRKDFPKKSSNVRQSPSSKPASSSTKFWKPTLSTAYLTTSGYSNGRKISPFCGTVGRINLKRIGSLYRPRRSRIPFNSTPPPSICSSDKSEFFLTFIFLPVITRKNGMEFLTQQNTVRVPPNRMESLILTIKQVLTQTQVSARTFLSLSGNLSSSRQTSFTPAPNVSVVSLETSYTSVGSSNFDHEYDSISLEVVDRPQSLRSGNIHPFPDPNAFIFTDASHYG